MNTCCSLTLQTSYYLRDFAFNDKWFKTTKKLNTLSRDCYEKIKQHNVDWGTRSNWILKKKFKLSVDEHYWWRACRRRKSFIVIKSLFFFSFIYTFKKWLVRIFSLIRTERAQSLEVIKNAKGIFNRRRGTESASRYTSFSISCTKQQTVKCNVNE